MIEACMLKTQALCVALRAWGFNQAQSRAGYSHAIDDLMTDKGQTISQ